jgi:hypothetical protein
MKVEGQNRSAMTAGDEVLEKRRGRRRAGDPRLTDTDRGILRRITGGEMIDEF